MNKSVSGVLVGSVLAIWLGGCGGDDAADPPPDMLWLAQADTELNMHLVDAKPFPY